MLLALNAGGCCSSSLARRPPAAAVPLAAALPNAPASHCRTSGATPGSAVDSAAGDAMAPGVSEALLASCTTTRRSDAASDGSAPASPPELNRGSAAASATDSLCRSAAESRLLPRAALPLPGAAAVTAASAGRSVAASAACCVVSGRPSVATSEDRLPKEGTTAQELRKEPCWRAHSPQPGTSGQ